MNRNSAVVQGSIYGHPKNPREMPLLLYTTTVELALGVGALVLFNLFGTFEPV